MANDSIPSLLHQTATELDARCDQILHESLGIGMSQFRILLVLRDHDGQPQQAVANDLKQTEASISRQANLLYGKGLLVKRIRSTNRREKLLFLSPKGQQTIEQATSILNDYLIAKFEVLSDHEQNKLRVQLFKILNTL